MKILFDGPIDAPGLVTSLPQEHKRTWREGQSRVAKRTTPPNLVCVHATDAENPAATVFASLSTRKLSVEFVIEQDGKVVQFLDPARFSAAHVGGLNARAIGIECVCRLHPNGNPRNRPESSQIVHVVNPDGTWLKSRRRACLGLFPAQVEALTLLVELLCSRMGIKPLAADPRDYVPPEERAALVGVIGHAQVTLKHGDPPLNALAPFYPF